MDEKPEVVRRTTMCLATGTGVIGCDTGPRASNHVYSALSVEMMVQQAESLMSTRKRSFGHGLPYDDRTGKSRSALHPEQRSTYGDAHDALSGQA